ARKKPPMEGKGCRQMSQIRFAPSSAALRLCVFPASWLGPRMLHPCQDSTYEVLHNWILLL
ncbi:MAG: hypothetical protein ACREXR_12485, partial [Gammaproteobacteria bacterium]